MTNQQVAEFHGMSLGGFKHWTPEQRRRARIEAEIDATPEVQKLIAELNRLAFVFDCKHVQGERQVMECKINRNSFKSLSVSIYEGLNCVHTVTVNMLNQDAVKQLLLARIHLEGLVYGQK